MERLSFGTRIIVLLTIGTIVLTLGYYNNRWKAVESNVYHEWQNVFEPPVVGRLAKSLRDGVFSAGGLLGLVDFDVTEGENQNVQIWMAPQRTIERQYDVYLNDKPFTDYTTYESVPGAQGIFLGTLERVSPFPSSTNLKIYRLIAALLSAFVLNLLFVWFAREFGLYSMVLNILFAAFSVWLTLLAGNIYWNLWAFFLPLVLMLYALKHDSRSGHFRTTTIGAILFVSALGKILFNGFEFVTTAWTMYSIPLVYYAVRDRWAWGSFVKRMAFFVGILMLTTFAGLFILTSQVASVEGGYAQAVSIILDALGRRSVGDPADYSGVLREALNAPVWTVLWNYLHFPSMFANVQIQNPLVNSIIHMEYWVWIIIFAAASILVLNKARTSAHGQWGNNGLALVAATWYSALAPLSWLILFKAHAYIHVRLAPVVWQMPFLSFGIALIGYALSLISKSNDKRSSHQDQNAPKSIS